MRSRDTGPRHTWPLVHGAIVPGYSTIVVRRVSVTCSVIDRPCRCGASDPVRHRLGASHRRPGPPGSARRIVGATRLPRPPLRAPWRHPRPRIGPGRRGRKDRRRRPPTAPRHRRAGPARPPRRRDAARRVVRMPAAGKIAGSTGGDGPFRHRRRLGRTNGTAGDGNGGPRLPTLVGGPPRSRYHGWSRRVRRPLAGELRRAS